MCAQMAYASEHPADSWLDRPLSERCVSYGVPFVGAGYNGYFQIFQSEDHVVIVQEMIHDARIIPLVDRPPLSDDIRLLHGDSRGHWDGDTLVVETRNYSPRAASGARRRNLQLTERFTRLGPTPPRVGAHDRRSYDLDGSWRISIPLKGTDEAIFEYACHEGNYGMTGILAGHRAHEAEGKLRNGPHSTCATRLSVVKRQRRPPGAPVSRWEARRRRGCCLSSDAARG